MAATTINEYSVELNQGPPGSPATYLPLRPNQLGGRLRQMMFTWQGASEVVGTNIALLKIPKGARLVRLAIAVSASLGSTTLSFGLAGANGNGFIDDGPSPFGFATGIQGTDSIGVQVADGVALISAATTYTSANTQVDMIPGKPQVYQAAPASEGVLSIATGAWLYMAAKDIYLTATTGGASLGTQVIQGYLQYVLD